MFTSSRSRDGRARARRRIPRVPSAASAVFLALACTTDVPTRPLTDVPTGGAVQFGRQPAAPASGVLSVCKQGGAGIPAGQAFTFRVTLLGVLRTVTVAAGSCLQLEVPRESSPLSKGHFQNTPTAVTRLLPGSTTLRVDGADLSAAQVQAILTAAPNVTASSSLLLNLAQQLIAAELNVLRGVQPSAEVLQAMADANVALQINVGAQLALTTTLDAAGLSPLVNTLSLFNEGKTKPPAAPLSVNIDVTEVVGPFIEVTNISCAPSNRCSGANLATARVTAIVESGATTAVTFTNRSEPVLRLCKVAGPGITAGRVFRIGAGGINVTDAALFDVPAGECRDEVLAEGNYQVAESGSMVGLAVSSITCDPAAKCTDVSLGVGVVTVAVARGITTVTFTNRSTFGTLEFCKVAGSGITAGRVFNMTAGGINLDGKPGEPTTASLEVPAGQCREATLLEGTYLAGEPNVPAGVAVSAITCEPAGRCSNVSLSVGMLNAQVVGATKTTVTLTNRSTLGTLRVCKVAGTGIEAGRTFAVNAAGINLSGRPGEPVGGNMNVPAGECRDMTTLEGLYDVAEFGPTANGTVVSSITCEPTTRCSDFSPSVRLVKADIVGASITTVTFTNRSIVALLRVCKLVGGGVNPGTIFRFTAGGINVPDGPEPTSATLDVPAGECRAATLREGLYDVLETPATGTSVSAISCLPAERCPDISVPLGLVKVTLVGGLATEVRVTNAITQ